MSTNVVSPDGKYIVIDDEVAEILDLDQPPEPRPPMQSIAEQLLTHAEAEKYLDAKGLLNWRNVPSAPPSILTGSTVMYSKDDLDWWAEKVRNMYCDVDDIVCGDGNEPLKFL